MEGKGRQTEARAAPTITLVSGDPAEEQAGWQLLGLLERYDLRKWQFTDEIHIDRAAIPHSMPVLTLNARHLQDDERALAAYLHEQLHWFAPGRRPEVNRAIEELRRRYPVTPSFPEGARDGHSTYLHLVVCPLEYVALSEVIGPDAARATLERGDVYTWIYATILREWDYFADLIERHGLVVAETPAAQEPARPTAVSQLVTVPHTAAAISGDGLQLYVHDLYRSAGFYIRALGFSVLYTRPFGIALGQPDRPESQRPALQYVYLRNGHMVLGLANWPALPADHHLRRGAEEFRGLGTEILLRAGDIHAAEQQVLAAGYQIESPVQQRPWGATDFRIIDPDGYYIRVTSTP